MKKKKIPKFSRNKIKAKWLQDNTENFETAKTKKEKKREKKDHLKSRGEILPYYLGPQVAEEQFGFKPGKGTTDAIRNLIQKVM